MINASIIYKIIIPHPAQCCLQNVQFERNVSKFSECNYMTNQ